MNAPRPVDVKITLDIVQLAREVARSGVPVLLKDDDEDLAILMPASSAQPDTVTSDADNAEQDTLLSIIGIGESEDPTDIARHEAEYLAEAYESIEPMRQ